MINGMEYYILITKPLNYIGPIIGYGTIDPEQFNME